MAARIAMTIPMLTGSPVTVNWTAPQKQPSYLFGLVILIPTWLRTLDDGYCLQSNTAT
jgi:hypothetical protein